MKKFLLSLAVILSVTSAAHALKEEPRGELTAIFSENFNGLVNGSESAPATPELSDGGKIDATLTGGLQWSGRGLREAGGALAVMHFEQSDWFGTESVQGYVRTPYTDVRMDGGNFTVRFRARTLGNESTKLQIELYDPYVTNNIDYGSVELTEEWTTYEIDLCHPGFGNHLAFLEMASLGEDWLLDDLEIVQDYFELLPPIVHYPRNVTYEQFTGRWNEAPLAESYLVTVYSLDDAGNRVTLIENVPTTESTMTVTGTEKGKDYFYVVRSVNDRYTSEESDPCRVYVPLSALDTPVTLDAENVSTDGFTARWEPTFRAMGYVIGLSRQYTATDDQLVTIVNEDFDKITDGDFSWPYPFYGNLDDVTSMPGWTYNYFCVRVVSGMFGLENTYKKYGEDVFLATPAIDLTGDGGKFTIELDVYGDKGDVVSVMCGDKTLKHTLESQGAQSFSVEFDNGTATTVIRFEFDGDGASQMLFFDNISIKQQVHAGDAVKENVGNYKTDTPETSYDFTGLNANCGDTFVYTVTAWSYSLDEDGVWGPDIFSEVSEPHSVVITDQAGLADVNNENTTVSIV
ncbi:MAG: fibronectin type III domain-containing protein, partial [Muribaculaceae bacterium]|nr:fibronectin type III domain-containing protein [Muribaculaceae bacterium]